MEERRGLNLAFDQVKEFHEAFNHEVGTKLKTLDVTRKIARCSWMREEIGEYMDADGNIVEEIDAMLDLIYFAMGTLVEMGVDDPQKFFDIIQSANMNKLWSDGKPHYREDGKVIKPKGWVAPETTMSKIVEDILEKQKNK